MIFEIKSYDFVYYIYYTNFYTVNDVDRDFAEIWRILILFTIIIFSGYFLHWSTELEYLFWGLETFPSYLFTTWINSDYAKDSYLITPFLSFSFTCLHDNNERRNLDRSSVTLHYLFNIIVDIVGPERERPLLKYLLRVQFARGDKTWKISPSTSNKNWNLQRPCRYVRSSSLV